jgi:hypothetical protein
MDGAGLYGRYAPVLMNVSNGRTIDVMPHEAQFRRLRSRLTPGEFDAMTERIDELIDAAGGEIATAGWLPGSDWTGTPFDAIYEKAARHDHVLSGLFFGQLVWFTVMNRPEMWGFGRYQKDGVDIGSMTYFRLRP